MNRATYQDAVTHLVDYLGGNPGDAVLRDCKRAIQEAYRDLTNAHRWTYLLRHGRIVTSPPYSGDDPASPATLTYDAATNVATIDGGSWPAWSDQAYLRLTSAADTPDPALYRGARVIDPSALKLDPEVNPGVDLAATTFTLHRDTYLLPEDFVGTDQALSQQGFGGLSFVHPRDWLFDARYAFVEGETRHYTITGDSQFPGRLVLRLTPFPTSARSIDFLYLRRPRPLTVAAMALGTATMASGSKSLSLTGAPTLAPSLIGSVVRISGAFAQPPTSPIGANPAVLEATILDIDSPTMAVLDAAAPFDLVRLPYVVSDPIDVEPGAMLTAFWRCCEKQVAVARTLKDKPAVEPAYRQALVEARQADSRSFAGRHVGECGGPSRLRLRDMPFTFAVE